jgi:hypothetical protein
MRVARFIHGVKVTLKFAGLKAIAADTVRGAGANEAIDKHLIFRTVPCGM